MRLSAFRFLFVSELVARMKRSVIRERHSSSQIVPGFRFAPSGLLGLQNSGANKIAPRERISISPLPARGGSVGVLRTPFLT
jgi:hypothetical protein